MIMSDKGMFDETSLNGQTNFLGLELQRRRIEEIGFLALGQLIDHFLAIRFYIFQWTPRMLRNLEFEL